MRTSARTSPLGKASMAGIETRNAGSVHIAIPAVWHTHTSLQQEPNQENTGSFVKSRTINIKMYVSHVCFHTVKEKVKTMRLHLNKLLTQEVSDDSSTDASKKKNCNSF